MNKRIGAMVMVLAMVCMAFGNASILVAASPGPVNETNDLVWIGDQAIGADVTYTDEVIYLTGNITIQNDATLTLVNTTIVMNSSVIQKYHLEILGGGELDMNTGSIIQANLTGNYYFWVRNTATMTLDESEIHGVGNNSNFPLDNLGGIWIESNDVSLTDSLIADCEHGLIFDSRFPAVLSGNNISDNNGVGMAILAQSNPGYNITGRTITDNNFINNGLHAIFMNATDIEVTFHNLNISGNDFGLSVIANNTAEVTMYNCEFWDNDGSYNNDDSNGSVLYVLTDNGTTTVTVYDNLLVDNGCGGVMVGYHWNDWWRSNETDVHMHNNTLIGTYYAGHQFQARNDLDAKVVDNILRGLASNDDGDGFNIGTHKHNSALCDADHYVPGNLTLEFSRNHANYLEPSEMVEVGGFLRTGAYYYMDATIVGNFLTGGRYIGGVIKLGTDEADSVPGSNMGELLKLKAYVADNEIRFLYDAGTDTDKGGCFDFNVMDDADVTVVNNRYYVEENGNQGFGVITITSSRDDYSSPLQWVNATITGNEIIANCMDNSNFGGFIRIEAEKNVNAVIKENILKFKDPSLYGEGAGGFIRISPVSGWNGDPDIGGLCDNITVDISDNTIVGIADGSGYLGGIIRLAARYDQHVTIENNDISMYSLYNTVSNGMDIGGVFWIGQWGCDYNTQRIYADINNNHITAIIGDSDNLGGAMRMFADELIDLEMNDNVIQGFQQGGDMVSEDDAKDFGIRIGKHTACLGDNDYFVQVCNETIVSMSNNIFGPGGKNSQVQINADVNMEVDIDSSTFQGAIYDDDTEYDSFWHAHGNGLTLDSWGTMTATITNSKFIDNRGAGLFVNVTDDATLNIENCDVYGNDWHGIYASSLAGRIAGSIIETNVYDNGFDTFDRIGTDGFGGYFRHATFDMENCTFDNPDAEANLDINWDSYITALNVEFDKSTARVENSSGIMYGGIYAEDVSGWWTGIAAGSFNITIDGISSTVIVNFVGTPSMADVALRIQNAIRALALNDGYNGSVVEYHVDATRFTIMSGNVTLGPISSVEVTRNIDFGVTVDISGETEVTNRFGLDMAVNGTSVQGTDGSWLLRKWFVDVKSEQESNGESIPYTDYELRNYAGALVASGTTGIDGHAPWIPVNEYLQNVPGMTYYTPHELTASKGPATGITVPPPLIDTSKVVIVQLDYISQPPVADAGSDISVNESKNFTLDGSDSTDDYFIVSWNWSCASANITVSGETATASIALPGDYLFELTVTDVEGYSDTANVTVSVIDVFEPVADAGDDQTVNEDTEMEFDGSGSTDIAGIGNYTWTFGSVTLYGEQPVYTFPQPGVYNVTLTVSDPTGNTGTDTVVITILDITDPVADAGVGSDCAECLTVIFDGSDSSDNVGIVSYIWTFNDGANDIVLSGALLNYSFTLLGNKTITLTCTDAAGNVGTGTTWVNVIDVTDPSVLIVAPGESLSGVPIDWTLVIVFDEPMNQDSVEEAFSIEGASVTGFEWDSSGRYVTVSLEDLDFETDYVFTVNSTAEDVAGNPLSDEHSGSFTTITGPVEADSPSFLEDYWWIFIVIALVVVIMFQAMKGGSKEPAAPVEEETPSEESTEETPAEEPAPEAEPETEPEIEAEPEAEPAEEELVE